MGSSSGQSNSYDLSFKILLIGDSGVGKSSLLVSFISNSVEDLAPTIVLFGSVGEVCILGRTVYEEHQIFPLVFVWFVLP
ncbi:RAB GTPase homolog C2A [Actinidia rufa]|uniref:RAB GTPase homolog C2A n=1 Tax=Actinidia rufa TaxID=165716 RepID=A0A7J0F505_9ERIC|nr:RAB GTPase homolog C2A [Actinidia rufa]